MSTRAADGSAIDSSISEPVDLRAARERLEAALDDARSNVDPSQRDEPSVDAFVADARDVLERATSAVAVLFDADGRNASLDDSRAAFDDLLTVVDEAADLLETVDPGTVSEAVEFKHVPAAIDPKPLATGDFADAIEFERLVALVDFGTLLRGVDVWSFYEEKSDVDDAVANATENLHRHSDREHGERGRLGRRLQDVYDQTREASNAVDTNTTDRNSSRNPLRHSTVPSRKRPDMGRSARLSTVPKR